MAVDISNTIFDQRIIDAFNSVITDLAAIRTAVNANVVDIAALKSAHDTLATKLNADAGVTDTNYAATAALTGAAVAVL